jgi:flagellar biosynthesis GTPase FlhF
MDNFNLEEAEERFRRQQRKHVPNPPVPPKKPQTAKKGKTPMKSVKPKVTEVPSIPNIDPKNLEKLKVPPRKKAKVRKDQRKGVEKGYFRHNSKSTFLTVPQYKGTKTKYQVLEDLKTFCEKKGNKVTSAIVCLEKHGKKDKLEGPAIELEIDPGVHFHVLFKISKQWNVRNQFYFDEIFDQHVHIESAKDYNACILYCAKEGDYVTYNINVEQTREAMKTHKGVKHIEVAQKIIDEPDIPLLELVTTYPGYMLQHQKKVIDFQTLNQNIRVTTEPYPGIGDVTNLSPEVQQIAKWLNENLPPVKRVLKQKQLYIYGPTNIGKTTLLMKLQEHFHTYIVPEEDKFWSNFHDNYDLCILDEFNGMKTITQLNNFCDGSKVPLTAKHVSAVNKTRNIPVIICSNKSPAEVFCNVAEKNPVVLKAFEERFERVNCSSFESGIDFLNIPWKQPQVDLEKSDDSLLIPEEEEKPDTYIDLDDSVEAFKDPFLEELESSEESITIRHPPANPHASLFCPETLDLLSSTDESQLSELSIELRRKRKRDQKK